MLRLDHAQVLWRSLVVRAAERCPQRRHLVDGEREQRELHGLRHELATRESSAACELRWSIAASNSAKALGHSTGSAMSLDAAALEALAASAFRIDVSSLRRFSVLSEAVADGAPDGPPAEAAESPEEAAASSLPSPDTLGKQGPSRSGVTPGAKGPPKKRWC